MHNDTTQITPHTLGNIQGDGDSNAGFEAWRKLIGSRPVGARLELLPETRIRPTAWLTSVVLQTTLAALLVAIPLLFPSRMSTLLSYEVTPVAAIETQVLLPAERQPPPRAALKPEVVASLRQIEPPRLSRQTLLAPLVPRRSARIAVDPADAPVIDQNFAPLALEDSREPTRPREPVKIGVISDGIPAPATVASASQNTTVQTGSFGQIRTQSAATVPDNTSQGVRLGALDIPARATTGTGTGVGSSMKSDVKSSGFGNLLSSPAPPNPPQQSVKSGGFSAVTVEPNNERSKAVESVARTEPVVILQKPNPVYTDEARQLGIEGEVQVRAVFMASGTVNVLGVLKGLGHGLDEAAMRAARQIRFKPAQQDGAAVDFPATIRIVFQLAF
jgi:TonB family protein